MSYRIYQGRDAMGKETCELCGHKSKLGAIQKYQVVPMEITQRGGILESRVVRLCLDCHRELTEWYSTKVANTAYDAKTKRFREKSPPEMAKEYESAYDSFMKYKQKQKGAK